MKLQGKTGNEETTEKIYSLSDHIYLPDLISIPFFPIFLLQISHSLYIKRFNIGLVWKEIAKSRDCHNIAPTSSRKVLISSLNKSGLES